MYSTTNMEGIQISAGESVILIRELLHIPFLGCICTLGKNHVLFFPMNECGFQCLWLVIVLSLNDDVFMIDLR